MDVTERATTVVDLLPQAPDLITEVASDAIDRIADVDVVAAAEVVGDLAVDGLTIVGEGTTIATRSVVRVVRRHPRKAVGLAAVAVGLIIALKLMRRRRQPRQLELLDAA